MFYTIITKKYILSKRNVYIPAFEKAELKLSDNFIDNPRFCVDARPKAGPKLNSVL